MVIIDLRTCCASMQQNMSSDKNIRFVTALDQIKCCKQVKKQRLLPTWAHIHDLPSYIITMYQIENLIKHKYQKLWYQFGKGSILDPFSPLPPSAGSDLKNIPGRQGSSMSQIICFMSNRYRYSTFVSPSLMLSILAFNLIIKLTILALKTLKCNMKLYEWCIK